MVLLSELRGLSRPTARWGWALLILTWAYRGLDAWGNWNFLKQQSPAILTFLSSTLGLLILNIAGFALILMAIFQERATPANHPTQTARFVPQPPDKSAAFSERVDESIRKGRDLLAALDRYSSAHVSDRLIEAVMNWGGECHALLKSSNPGLAAIFLSEIEEMEEWETPTKRKLARYVESGIDELQNIRR